MQAMTDEQYKEVFIAAISAFNDVLGASKSVEKARTASGRAAVEKAAPYLLGKPKFIEGLEVDSGCTMGELDFAIRLFANRLAQYTVKPDPAIEAVRKYLVLSRDTTEAHRIYADNHAAAIVAEVRAADAAGGKQ